MSIPTIATRLSVHIKEIEQLLNIKRIHFVKKKSNSFYSCGVSFTGREVKSSARYLYQLGKKGDKQFTMSFGFFFYKPCPFGGSKHTIIPIEDQRVVVSYGLVTEKDPNDCRFHDNKADYFDKEIIHSEEMDINQAKSLFKEFKRTISGTTQRNSLDVIKMIETIFMNRDVSKESSEVDAYVEYMSDFVEEFNTNNKACIDAEKKVKSSIQAKNKELQESEERKRFDELQALLKEASANLSKKETELKKKHKITENQRDFNAKKAVLRNSINEVKDYSTIYLQNQGLPFRFFEHIDLSTPIDLDKY